ncbi:MAG: hypothetical protein GX571_11755, partial [Lentisphaerae bacterium]|nr:hypothetical protein [Lentisphaerota bacterium]
MKRIRALHVVLIYNSHRGTVPETPEDHGSTDELRVFIRAMARALRRLGHRVTVLGFSNDLLGFQRRLARLSPDVVFNQF